MPNVQANIHTVNVPEPEAEDRAVILELHKLGHAFTKAVGAYIADNATKFPSGTLSKIITPAEDSRVKGLGNKLSALMHDTSLTMDEIHDQSIYYGVHLHCMSMQTEERYLASLNVSFKEVADSIDVDASDRAAIDKKLAVCEKYGFTPMAQLLNLKLAA